MDLRHLRYIVAAARNGSFSAAANEFNVRQPIVSKRIKEVEEELGVRLFERSTAGAQLTLLGEDFVVDARRVLDETEQMARHAKASREGTLGHVIVGFYKSLSAGAFRAAVSCFRKQYPDIDVELVELPFADIAAGVMSGALDAAIVLGDAGKCEMFKTIGLWSEHLVVALPKDHPLAGKPIVYWPDLRGERFLVTVRDPGPDIRVVLLRHLAAPSDHPVIVTCRLSRESLLSEVAEGRGVALQCASATGLTSLGVVFRPVHDGGGATRLGYVACWKPDNANPALKTFLNAIRPHG
jgi:DNA-binding transcriptional LysR family regulator